MFSSSFNISDVVEKKSNLRHVSQTTITHLDGSRYIQNNQNGSLSELASGSKDEDGQWAVLDEASALGLSAAEEEKKTSSSSSSSSSDDDANNAILVELLKKHPELSQYLNFIKVGVPTHAIKSKLIEGNVNNKIPQNDIESFLQAIGATGFSDNCCLDAAVGESKDVLFQQSSPVGKPLKGDFSELHGHLGNPSWDAPTLASYSNTPARAGYNTEKSHEYLDSPQVLKEKVKLLASMLVKASKPVIYAGAGLSTASGIGDYATQTGKSGVLAQNGHKGANVSPFCVSPNFGHHCIAALSKRGLVHRFVQQNHDGLPQKAGMSQGLINEIHGGWFDPSNPVVAMSGNLRTDLFDDLLRLEQETDLVIAVGSSLCGMNADRLVSTSALKARTYRERMALKKSSSSSNLKEEFGSVIISLQKTVHDHNSSLRIFALIDDVFKLLAEELKLDLSHLTPDPSPQAAEGHPEVVESEQDHVFLVPYNERGLPIDINESNQNLRKLDLSDGALLTITDGPDKGAKAVMIGRNKDGHYRISVERTFKKTQRTFTETRLLGRWWPQNAIDGEVSYIPVVNRTAP